MQVLALSFLAKRKNHILKILKTQCFCHNYAQAYSFIHFFRNDAKNMVQLFLSESHFTC